LPSLLFDISFGTEECYSIYSILMPNTFYAFDYLSPFLFKFLSVLLNKGKTTCTFQQIESSRMPFVLPFLPSGCPAVCKH